MIHMEYPYNKGKVVYTENPNKPFLLGEIVDLGEMRCLKEDGEVFFQGYTEVPIKRVFIKGFHWKKVFFEKLKVVPLIGYRRGDIKIYFDKRYPHNRRKL